MKKARSELEFLFPIHSGAPKSTLRIHPGDPLLVTRKVHLKCVIKKGMRRSKFPFVSVVQLNLRMYMDASEEDVLSHKRCHGRLIGQRSVGQALWRRCVSATQTP